MVQSDGNIQDLLRIKYVNNGVVDFTYDPIDDPEDVDGDKSEESMGSGEQVEPKNDTDTDDGENNPIEELDVSL